MANQYQELLIQLNVTVTDRDYRRLHPHLANWPHLNEMLLLGITNLDLRKLIVIEMNDKQRPQILDKLCARLKTQELDTLRELVAACIRSTKK